MKWTKNEIQFLIDNYKDNSNEYISRYINRTESAIQNKAHILKLNKSGEAKREMLINRNKSNGRDLTKENLIKIALLYKTKAQFQRSDSSAYKAGRNLGILNEICKHMIPQSYSIPQLICKYIFDKITSSNSLYNTRKIIPPYEIDIYYPHYKFGIEYNGKGWHNENDNTIIKTKMCDDLDIYLFIVCENNRRYEEDIKEQIINNLYVINKLLDKKITKEFIINLQINDFIFDDILDKDSITKITSKYNYYKEFREKEINLYTKLCKLNKLEEFTNHMIRTRTFNKGI